GLVGVVGLDDVEPAIAVVVANSHAHAALGRPVLVEGTARVGAYLLERSILIVVVETAWDGVARYVDVRPAVVVEVRRTHSESVRARGHPLVADRSRRRWAARDRHTRVLGDVLKRSVAAIAVQDVRPAAHSLRASSDGHTIILAVLVLAGLRRHSR